MYLIPLATGYLAARQLAGNRRLEIPVTWEKFAKEWLVRLGLMRPQTSADGGQTP